MTPIFVGGEITNLLEAVTNALRQMLGEEELPEDLMRGLLAQKRLLVILDALSEREPASQRNAEESFAKEAIFNAVVITARAEPQFGAIQRTMLYPFCWIKSMWCRSSSITSPRWTRPSRCRSAGRFFSWAIASSESLRRADRRRL